jgi:uncharacterized protein
MIERLLQPRVLDLAQRYPVVTITGPRQAGKTTLCRMAFPKMRYVSLEAPAEREFAIRDPRGFLERFDSGVILDEGQRAPELLSYIQVAVDESGTPGRFVLTGSQNLLLLDSISQSLAGRTAIVHLLPLAWEELQKFRAAPKDLFPVLWSGGYPRLHDRRLAAQEWLADYVTTYVERDVRQILNVGDLLAFQTFVRLSAGRTGQLVNLSSLGSDAGVTHATARSWLSVLEATFIIARLPPFHANFGKRLIKSPKLYFLDTGVLCQLLGIETPAQLNTHPLRGAIFESWVVSEILKYFYHRGRRPQVYFYRDQRGEEVDLLVESGLKRTAVEIKSSFTPSEDFYRGLERFASATAGLPERERRSVDKIVVYGGDETQRRSAGLMLSWKDIDSHDWLG